MAKTEVNGDNADPVFKYLRENSDLAGGDIPWNFGKFLINNNGDTRKLKEAKENHIHYLALTLVVFSC